MAKFEIPQSYADKLEVVEVIDTRNDEEILATFTQYIPVTSEKNIWAFWVDGVLSMPAWCQRNAIDWVRICGPAWTIRVMDNKPESLNYALRYLSRENLPDCFIDRTQDGPYIGQHAADFVRAAAIYEHGGVWMDVGTILVMHMDRICWDTICDSNSPYEVATIHRAGQWIFNYFVAARKHNPFIRHWLDLQQHLWKGRTNNKGIARDPLFGYLKTIFAPAAAQDAPSSAGEGKNEKGEEEGELEQQKPSGDLDIFDWKVSLAELLDYAFQMAAWHRLALISDTGDGFSGVEYMARHVLLLYYAPETGMPMKLLGAAKTGAARTMALMSMQRNDGSGDDRNSQEVESLEHEKVVDDERKVAEHVVWETLANSSFWKIPHAKGLTHNPQLGTLLDQEEAARQGGDGEGKAATAAVAPPGSFMELLRYGTLHFRQKRRGPSLRDASWPERTLQTGLLEP